MEVLIKYLACGKIYKNYRSPALCVTKKKISDLNTKIIPLFDNKNLFME
jgi:hypothetical protein